jgi:hypothetical protein
MQSLGNYNHFTIFTDMIMLFHKIAVFLKTRIMLSEKLIVIREL